MPWSASGSPTRICARFPRRRQARRELAELVSRYRAAKRRRATSSTSATRSPSRRTRPHPEVGRVLREEFRVVLLDEYQDTSVAQRVLLAGLFGGGTGHPVTAVGDPCQAITAGAARPSPTSTTFPSTSRTRTAAPRPARRSARTAAAAAGSSTWPTGSPSRCARCTRAWRHCARPPAPNTTDRSAAHLLRTHAEEIDWIADSIAHLVRTGTAPGRSRCCAARRPTSRRSGRPRRP